MVDFVANRLGPLNREVVFLGGAAAALLITDPAAPAIRYTMDVDVVVEIGSLLEYYRLSDRLRELGFREKAGEGEPICRWTIEDVVVDVMPTTQDVLGFSNRWYAGAFAYAADYPLPSGTVIRLVTAPYFLATKLEAFAGRGKGEYLVSHDVEDLVAVIDGRPGIEDEVAGADPDVRIFLGEQFRLLLADEAFVEAIAGHLPPDAASQARGELVRDRMGRMVSMAA
jgi:hypothetical protein